jgi:hypothetical protein
MAVLKVAHWVVSALTLSRSRNQRHIVQQAVKSAYTRFAQENPAWAESLFDIHFLTQHAAPILTQFAQSGDASAVRALAGEWVDQLQSNEDLRERRVISMLPVAAEFLCLLETELAITSYAGWVDRRYLPCGQVLK